jgi:meso-butanediol dehydrogenase/(S,S)-butanediol dehydrogenase/diacetyl reductase
MRRFEDRVAFVTAAGQGIGRAVARRIAAEGGAVIVTDLDGARADQVAGEIIAEGGRALGFAVDVTSPADIHGAVAGGVLEFGRLDVLVNNAGGCVVTTEPEKTGLTEWHRQLDLTLISAVQCIQVALPHLLQRRGNVVTISSVNALGAFGNLEYSAAKAGQVSMTQNFAVRYGSSGVRFNVVAPGTIRTPNWDHQPEVLNTFVKMYPLGRIGEPEDIAAAVAFLASDDASWITGLTLPVEGGVLAGPPTLDLTP